MYLLKSRKNECRNAPCKALGVLKRDPVPVQGFLTAYIYIYQKKKKRKKIPQTIANPFSSLLVTTFQDRPNLPHSTERKLE